MPIYSSTITDLVANKSPQPYYRFDGSDDVIQIGDVGFIDALKERQLDFFNIVGA